MNFQDELIKMGQKAKAAGRQLAVTDTATKNACLEAIAKAILDNKEAILNANEKDLEAGVENNLTSALLDRLKLTEARMNGMVEGLRQVAALPDPVGSVDKTHQLENGLDIQKVRVPIGTIGIIYESRPNVTVDAAALCLKAGNTVILRGGKEAIHSNKALAEAIAEGCRQVGLHESIIQLIPWIDREVMNHFVKLNDYIDVIIPRGGEGLIRFVAQNATVPVIKHYKGVCHIYVDKGLNDLTMARDIIENAKCQRPGVCNAVETVLIHKDIASDAVPIIIEPLLAGRCGTTGRRELL